MTTPAKPDSHHDCCAVPNRPRALAGTSPAAASSRLVTDGRTSAGRRRERRRDLAEDVCRSLRQDVVDYGHLTGRTLRYLARWQALAGKGFYQPPRPIRKRTWTEMQDDARKNS